MIKKNSPIGVLEANIPQIGRAWLHIEGVYKNPPSVFFHIALHLNLVVLSGPHGKLGNNTVNSRAPYTLFFLNMRLCKRMYIIQVDNAKQKITNAEGYTLLDKSTG